MLDDRSRVPSGGREGRGGELVRWCGGAWGWEGVVVGSSSWGGECNLRLWVWVGVVGTVPMVMGGG